MEELRRYSLCYLATPYSQFPEGIDEAFRQAAKLTAEFVRNGVRVYSPITHSHPMHVHGGIDELDHEFWLRFDETFMEKSDALIVALMNGWDKSRGVLHEIGWFSVRTKPIYYIDPETLDVEFDGPRSYHFRIKDFRNTEAGRRFLGASLAAER